MKGKRGTRGEKDSKERGGEPVVRGSEHKTEVNGQ